MTKPRPTQRADGERQRRAAVQAPGDGGRQVLGLQARAEPCVRGDGVPRRRGLCGGVGDAADLPRGAAGLDLGGLGQRDQPRRAARAGAHAALAGGVPATRSSRRRAPTRAWTPASRIWSPSSRTPRRSSRARGGWSRAWRCACRARCSCATLRRRWRTRSAPRGWRATAGWSTGRCRPARTSRRSSPAQPRRRRYTRAARVRDARASDGRP